MRPVALLLDVLRRLILVMAVVAAAQAARFLMVVAAALVVMLAMAVMAGTGAFVSPEPLAHLGLAVVAAAVAAALEAEWAAAAAASASSVKGPMALAEELHQAEPVVRADVMGRQRDLAQLAVTMAVATAAVLAVAPLALSVSFGRAQPVNSRQPALGINNA